MQKDQQSKEMEALPEESSTEETYNDQLDLQWTTSDWSRCSQTCGENGTQIRTVECTMVKMDKEEIIPYQICVDAGMDPPAAIQSCGLTHCPM